MALRGILKDGDETLKKKSRAVDKFDQKLYTLLDDMAETLAEYNGVGIAAPQVGILKRVIVIDTGECFVEAINPRMIKCMGEQTDVEGCLSLPGKFGEVVRPLHLTLIAQDRNGKEFAMEAEGLLARAVCHEVDHLDGLMFYERATRMVSDAEMKRRRNK